MRELFADDMEMEPYWALRLLLKGVPQTLFIRVVEDSVRRLQRALLDGVREGFWEGESTEGYSFLLRLSEVQLVNVCFDFAVPTPPEPAAANSDEDAEDEAGDDDEPAPGAIEIWLRGRADPYVCSSDDDPEELELLYQTAILDEPGFIQFVDEDGERVFVSVSELVLLKMPDALRLAGGSGDGEGEDDTDGDDDGDEELDDEEDEYIS